MNSSFDNEKLFMSIDNQKSLINQIYTLHLQHGFRQPITYFYQIVPAMMKKWCQTNDLNSFETLGLTSDYVETLRYINSKFVSKMATWAILDTSLHAEVPDIAQSNDIQISYTCPDQGPKSTPMVISTRKKHKDLLVEDYGKLDVWAPMMTSVRNGNYRRNNQINIDQISRHARPYDRANATEGLRATIDNSSYTNHHIRSIRLLDFVECSRLEAGSKVARSKSSI